MTQSDLYRIRDFVPNFDAIAAEFAARSRALTARANVRADIAYGAGPRETLDLILPDNPAADAPLHIFIHGGYWRSGEKENYRLIAEPVMAAGGMTTLVEYDLMPGTRLSYLGYQVSRPGGWHHDNAQSLVVSTELLTVGGHSASTHPAPN